jgi:hypothetical protein
VSVVILTAVAAVRRHPCLLCPDPVQPGEIVALHPGLVDAGGRQGFAHADCAERHGYCVTGIVLPTDADAIARRNARIKQFSAATQRGVH